MKICIPARDDRGLDAVTHDHFGSAPFYAIVDTETEEVRMIRNRGGHHGHGECRPAEHLSEDVEAVVCSGMGKRALSSIEESGIEVFLCVGRTVGDVLSSARRGLPRRLMASEACGGGQGRGHGGGI